MEAQRGVPLLGGIVGDVTGCGKDMEVVRGGLIYRKGRGHVVEAGNRCVASAGRHLSLVE